MTLDRFTFTIPEAAQAIGIGRSTLYKLINEGELRTVRLGTRVLVPRDSVLELLGMEAGPTATVETPGFRQSEEHTFIVTIRPARPADCNGGRLNFS